MLQIEDFYLMVVLAQSEALSAAARRLRLN